MNLVHTFALCKRKIASSETTFASKGSNFAPNKSIKTKKIQVMTTIKDYIKQIYDEAKSREGAAMRHYEAGKRDSQAGVYDKWYRYNAANDGMAYDLGWTEQNKQTQNGVVRFLDA